MYAETIVPHDHIHANTYILYLSDVKYAKTGKTNQNQNQISRTH